ncbi:MAG: type III restriction system methylase [Ignavibacteria bacterium]|nr:MAG: type III restriction system methylase [Ignavibacteria bacterium]KAF0161794.1 MAG: type III restriction system methylase [Ignavibacteria bacterium]
MNNVPEDISSNNQVKTRQRVTDHGEVFTSEREVNAMLDLVMQETERIDSRFLEPACGTGNFLVEILKRKLTVVSDRYSKNQLEYERYAILALSSIYGVELLKDNVQTCRDRLLGVFTHFYLNNYKKEFKPECLKSAEFILSRNILWGDALSLKTPDEKAEPIVFSEWSAVNGSMIKRREYTMANLLESQPMEGLNLFSDLGDKAFIPTPVAEFQLIHFLKLSEL